MSEFTDAQKKILNQYPKPIVHMRHRHKRKKFSLVLGAGISSDFGIPTWTELLDRIADDRDVRGKTLLARNKKSSHGPKTQILFHQFAAKRQAHNQNLQYGEIKSHWQQIVRKHLYKHGKKDVDALVDKHAYIRPFIKIIQDSPMTVNYNFDDYLEKILYKRAIDAPSPDYVRSFETVWDPQLQTKLDRCVIYHPNGFLPESNIERQSGGLIFCEDEFADQLIETMAGRYASLLHHYSQNTCLFIGLSLEDSTLKHLLRQGAILNPGHYHYYVDYYKKSSDKPAQQEQQAIREANFNLYNLVTLFLTGDELRELGYLIALDDTEFHHNAALAKINLAFCYYIVGAIAVGKSSVISFYRNLTTHDEWPDFRLPELGKRYKGLPSDKERKIDNWINKQFKKKNDILFRVTSGLHIIDRAPLDPIAFKKKSKRAARANSLKQNVCDSQSCNRIRNGHVILITGESTVLETRAKASGKEEYTAKDLNEMQDVLDRVYSFKRGRSTVDAQYKTKEEVVKEVARIIHNPSYEVANLDSRLENIRKGIFKC